MSYLVSQGTRDIGIRAALGATRRNILGMVLRQGTALAAAGLAIGLAGAWTLARFMQSLLIGVSGTDRLTFIAVALLLAVVAIVAVLIPAARAARIDPIVALRRSSRERPGSVEHSGPGPSCGPGPGSFAAPGDTAEAAMPTSFTAWLPTMRVTTD
jgi:predicted lysophospholipase L1 biosynthesis ABC-type transport system permease subunit